MAIPKGFYGKLFPRSGLFRRHLITCDTGVIDADYRGAVEVLLMNHYPHEVYTLRTGDRIGQIVFMKKYNVIFEKVSDPVLLGRTKRGSDGFGSTGSIGNKMLADAAANDQVIFESVSLSVNDKVITDSDISKRHIENCAGVPGVIYNFNTKNLISFQDNFNAKDDFPFVLYFDFETTAPTDNCFDSEQKNIFFVSYVLIVTFHPALKLNRIIIQRSYAHSLEQLTSLNYFSKDQMKFIVVQIIRQLKDIATDVSKRKCKNTMGQMFCIECTLVKTLLDWFNKKYRMQYLEISAFVKMQYGRNNPVTWRNDK